MSEIDPSLLNPDEFYLSGRLQVDAAIDVLTRTGVNPSTQRLLTALRDAHALFTHSEAKNDLTIYLEGESAKTAKADVIASALLAESNENLPEETRIAARGLLGIFGIEK